LNGTFAEVFLSCLFFQTYPAIKYKKAGIPYHQADRFSEAVKKMVNNSTEV